MVNYQTDERNKQNKPPMLWSPRTNIILLLSVNKHKMMGQLM